MAVRPLVPPLLMLYEYAWEILEIASGSVRAPPKDGSHFADG